MKMKRGRKTIFKDKVHDEAIKLARHGLTLDEIADFWNIHRATLYRWLRKYPEFSDALKKAKAEADRKVEESLYKRALGYKYEEKHYEKFGKEMVLKKTIEKQIAPDVTAQIFWLKNRRPENWRDDRALLLTGDKDSMPIPIQFVEVASKSSGGGNSKKKKKNKSKARPQKSAGGQ